MKKKVMLGVLVFLFFAFIGYSCNNKQTINIMAETSTKIATVSPTDNVEIATDVVVSTVEVAPTKTPYKGNPDRDVMTWDAKKQMWVDGDPYQINGYYYWMNNVWIPGLITVESQFMEFPNITIGSAWAYDFYMMEATAKYNGYDLSGVVDGVAIMSCAEKGNYVWLQREGHDWEGPFLVVDCAGYLDQYNVVAHREEVVEVGFETAKAWGMADRKQLPDGSWETTWYQRRFDNVIVSKINPECLPEDVAPVVLKDWFLERVSFYETYDEYMNEYKNWLPLVTKTYVGYTSTFYGGEWHDFTNNSLMCEP
jgi:hypothetical protein